MSARVKSSRAEALASGELRDVSELAKAVGVDRPAAMSRAAWERCTASLPTRYSGDLETRIRLVQLLYTCWLAIQDSSDEGPFVICCLLEQELTPEVLRDPDELVELMVVREPGDAGEPVLTILLLKEYGEV